MSASESRDSWAKPIHRLRVEAAPPAAINMNVDGRHLVGPLQGFGQLWQKTYRVRLSGVTTTPQEVMQVWKARFADFQPSGNRFYPGMSGIKPGEVLLIDATLPAVPGLPGVIPVSTGVLVMFADDVSFTVATPEGHPESGWNTFSVFEQDGAVVAQVQSLGRANDPVYEFGLRFMGGSRMQEQTWQHVLGALARHFGVDAPVRTVKTCLDAKLQWSQFGNIRHNAGIRTFVSAPLRFGRRLLRR
ncbi:MAG: DUF1990 family protein [Candidatus Promineifilaceae bacterium]|nr:DUF1990 family protein [Candidatus Promineifilaceae bacterium]